MYGLYLLDLPRVEKVLEETDCPAHLKGGGWCAFSTPHRCEKNWSYGMAIPATLNNGWAPLPLSVWALEKVSKG